MHILLVNDDGFHSPNLALLAQAAARRGHRVTVAAPATQQSAKSHAFTLWTPLVVTEDSMEGAEQAYRIEGTPVDACRLGLLALAVSPVDLVISGINVGYNVGLATFVSGTVGAAREAAFHGYPAMAVSSAPDAPQETVAFFADYCIRLGEKLVQSDLPEQAVCNVNLPPREVGELGEPVVCRLNRHVYRDGYEGRVSPRGSTYYWLGPEVPDDEPCEGSDSDWLKKGHLSVTLLTPEGCRQEAYADLPVKLFE